MRCDCRRLPSSLKAMVMLFMIWARAMRTWIMATGCAGAWVSWGGVMVDVLVSAEASAIKANLLEQASGLVDMCLDQ